MKEVDKRRTPNTNNRAKPRVAKTEKKNPKPNQTTNGKASNVKDGGSKESRGKTESVVVVSESNTATEQSEVYEDLVIHYVDDLSRSQEVSDSETIKDSVSSQGSVMEEKAEESVSKNDSTENDSQESKETPCSDDESEQNVEEQEKESVLEKKIEEMEARIEKLEEELREVAALEIALYSVVPEHGSSAHKVHTPARRLSRIHIHACKYWSQQRRATVAKNTVSGLLLVAKSCGNDVARLTFWLSNTVVLREIISQTFGGSRHSNGHGKLSDMRSSTIKWKAGPGSKDINGFNRLSEDWQDTGTFIAALERVESWIFSRVVESVWWQALTPHMQSPMDDALNSKNTGRISGPALGDQKQGNFSISLWKNAFQDAAQRLCPVRASGHECGCLPVLARMLMEQCIARLDVAMFNAILRESAHEIPTDPVSDPIVDSRVLPIPAGDLSFGSGAQLKNSIGNWSRWLTDMFGMDADDAPQEDEESDIHGKKGKSKSFLLLNALSDLLMLPKDLLMDRSIRKEVCPSITLPLVKRILCNFTPDEFCPDPVPGAVLEALNAESIVERNMSGISTRSFPYTVASVVYTPPSPADVAEKCAVSDAVGKIELARNVSVVQRKGYTSDEELEELESPLSSIVDKLPSSPNVTEKGAGKRAENATNERYELLSEVWSA